MVSTGMRRAMAAITVMLAAACAHPDGSARSNWPTPSAASDMRITPPTLEGLPATCPAVTR
ncbi:putative lipoprotein [Mycobacterium xenopi 4042]|uniref:Putative lipoprotein n=1 Tax=Mycobacterium xenopi 4042 TaxID=1299334 RepID=X8AEQ3_MYCXE|nr:putative lipoprotein [Mycobacterium xenopi 4042]